MMCRARSHFASVLFVVLCTSVFHDAPLLHRDRDIPAVVPVPQTADWWMPQHERNVARVRQGTVDLLMIGDSITQGWSDEGRRVWDRYYAHRRAVNLGFNSDRTEHVLWRLQHGEIDGIHPKVAVVLIGTNNTGSRNDAPEHTAAGIQAIVSVLRAKLPETRILLLGIFPRGLTAMDTLRRTNTAINDRIRGMGDGREVIYQDLGHLFVDPGGRLNERLMPDLLHPNEAGYQVWAERMESQIKALLGE